MGAESVAENPPNPLSYATPARHVSRLRPTQALIGGMFLVITAALTLLIGFLMASELSLSGDAETACLFAVCIFSAICLFAGLPLIYRSSRSSERIE